MGEAGTHHPREREFSIDNLLIRDPFIIEMMRWTGLGPWEFVLPFPGSLTSIFLGGRKPISPEPLTPNF